MNTVILASLPPENKAYVMIALIIVPLIFFILGWMFNPWTVGAMAQRIQSPLKKFIARLATSTVGAIGAFALLKVMFGENGSKANTVASNSSQDKPAIIEPSDRPLMSPTETPQTAPQAPPLPKINSVEETAAVKPSAPATTNTSDTATATPAVQPVDNAAKSVVEVTKEPKPSEPEVQSVDLKIAELKGELAAVDAKIQSERQRWKEGTNLINRLTNFKSTPVREGSPQYHQCMAASRAIQEVEAGATALKAEKARLEAIINSLEGKE